MKSLPIFRKAQDALIRPTRFQYSIDDLGPRLQDVGQGRFYRKDLVILNSRRVQLHCSHWIPVDPCEKHSVHDPQTLPSAPPPPSRQRPPKSNPTTPTMTTTPMTTSTMTTPTMTTSTMTIPTTPTLPTTPTMTTSTMTTPTIPTTPILKGANDLRDSNESLSDSFFSEKKTGACIVYLHCNSGSRVEALEALPVAMAYNMSVFGFDFSGAGMSGGETISLGFYEKEDLSDILHYLSHTEKIDRFILWGRSMGAVTSLLFASSLFPSPPESSPSSQERGLSPPIPVRSRFASPPVRKNPANGGGGRNERGRGEGEREREERRKREREAGGKGTPNCSPMRGDEREREEGEEGVELAIEQIESVLLRASRRESFRNVSRDEREKERERRERRERERGGEREEERGRGREEGEGGGMRERERGEKEEELGVYDVEPVWDLEESLDCPLSDDENRSHRSLMTASVDRQLPLVKNIGNPPPINQAPSIAHSAPVFPDITSFFPFHSSSSSSSSSNIPPPAPPPRNYKKKDKEQRGGDLLFSKCLLGIIADSPFSSLWALVEDIAQQSLHKAPDSVRMAAGHVISHTLKQLRKSILKKAKFDLKEVNPCEDVKRCQTPVLLICGGHDELVHPTHVIQLYNCYYGNDKTLIYSNTTHNGFRPSDCWFAISRFLYRTTLPSDGPHILFTPIREEREEEEREGDLKGRERSGSSSGLNEEREERRRENGEKIRFELINTPATSSSTAMTNLTQQQLGGGPVMLDGTNNDSELLVRCSICEAMMSIEVADSHSSLCGKWSSQEREKGEKGEVVERGGKKENEVGEEGSENREEGSEKKDIEERMDREDAIEEPFVRCQICNGNILLREVNHHSTVCTLSRPQKQKQKQKQEKYVLRLPAASKFRASHDRRERSHKSEIEKREKREVSWHEKERISAKGEKKKGGSFKKELLKTASFSEKSFETAETPFSSQFRFSRPELTNSSPISSPSSTSLPSSPSSFPSSPSSSPTSSPTLSPQASPSALPTLRLQTTIPVIKTTKIKTTPTTTPTITPTTTPLITPTVTPTTTPTITPTTTPLITPTVTPTTTPTAAINLPSSSRLVSSPTLFNLPPSFTPPPSPSLSSPPSLSSSSKLTFAVCAMRCCKSDKRPPMCPRLLEIQTSPSPAILVLQMFHRGVVFQIPFEVVLAIQSFGSDQNYLSVHCSNIASYVQPHKNAYALFETPYGVAPLIVNKYREIKKKLNLQTNPNDSNLE